MDLDSEVHHLGGETRELDMDTVFSPRVYHAIGWRSSQILPFGIAHQATQPSAAENGASRALHPCGRIGFLVTRR